MKRGTVASMKTDPVGCYVAGDRFVHFCASPELWGMILWGRPDGGVARELGKTLVLELAPPAVPHAALVDASRLEGADGGAFRALDGYMRSHGELLATHVLKLALVRPAGLSGAIVAGVYDVVPRPFAVEVFGGVAEAIAWLGADPSLEATLANVYDEVTTSQGVLGDLRELFRTRSLELTLPEAATLLSVSARTLQRKLAEHDTTFQHELALARVQRARELLRDADRSLTEIALEIGCASLQHFNALFRKHVGESPGRARKRWRERETE